MEEPLLVIREGALARVILNRPSLRNAFDAALIAELERAFTRLGLIENVRAIVIEGMGSIFCGGADLNWMRDSLDLTYEQNLEDARAMSRMFRTIDRSPKPTIARITGAAFGGGAGLAAVCDIAIATRETIFGFSETRLGILPAVISPFVLAKIGLSNARALALTGEVFDAQHARAIGLIHKVVKDEAQLNSTIASTVERLLVAAPSAIAATKALFSVVDDCGYDESLEPTVTAIAQQRTSPEGQDGIRAFLEKRPPAWTR
jgi:methylglutaconyl-CoA hydratase